jgi:hypothetical protein
MFEHLRAHGFDPGPSQRPRTAGAMSAACASPIALVILERTRAIAWLEASVHAPRAITTSMVVVVLVLAGLAYAWTFRRAANDRRGGWMFGMSFGFVVWMVTAGVLRAAHLVAIGLPAIGLFGGLVLHGAATALVFPYIHRLLMRPVARAGTQRGVATRLPYHA